MLVTLGWMLLTGLPLPGSSPHFVHPAVPAHQAGRVNVWTDREDPYRRGEGARVYLSSGEPAHVTVFRVDTDGRIRVLFPREPWGDTFLRDDRAFEVSGKRGGRSFLVDDFPGVGYLFAVASPHPFDFEDITRGDYWDYRVVDGGRLRGDPYVLLSGLAERITRGADYDYDIAPYYVDRHYDYPRFVCYDCHAYASYDDWDPYERACRRFRMVIYDDPAGYPYRGGRGRNVVTPGRGLGPRFVFRDADPRREYVTRVPRSLAEDRRGSAEPRRTSEDVGGQGSVAAPGLPSLGRRSIDRGEPRLSPARPPIEERRRPSERRRRESGDDDIPEGLRPADGERRLTPSGRSPRTPQSTGEPELRRRKP